MPISIEAINLSKSFGANRAAEEVSLHVEQGQILGLLGPNGAGKTTCIRMITGELPPDAGEVSIGGQSLKADPIRAKRRIGYLPEGSPLYTDMTPKQFLRFCGRAHGLSRARITERLAYVSEKLHLVPVLNQQIDTLSKGFKRRVGLAQAILHDPEVLLLDEPTDGLDPLQKQEVRALLQELSESKAILISTHLLDEAEAICTHAAIIAKGKLLKSSTVESLLKGSRHTHLEPYFIELIENMSKAEAA